jgi:hypothetical protein
VPVDQVEFEFVARTPDGDAAPRRIRVKDVLDRASRLDEFAPACDQCPANNTGRPFGCVGAIGYPLSSFGESWLLDRVQPGPAAYLLRVVFEDVGLTGGNMARMRAAGGSFFEARVTPTRTDLGFSLAADELLEVIFCKGHLIPAHSAMILVVVAGLRFTRPVPDEADLPPGSAMLVARDEAGVESAQLFDIPGPGGDDDDTIRELKTFFRAMFLARGFGVRLLVDY